MINEFISAIVIAGAAYFGVATKNTLDPEMGAKVGLSLSWALNVNFYNK